jgi:hypothetical protein
VWVAEFLLEQLGIAHGTVKAIIVRGREEALRRYQAREDRELEKAIRRTLEERLNRWQPYPQRPSRTVDRDGERRPLRKLPDASRRAVRPATGEARLLP